MRITYLLILQVIVQCEQCFQLSSLGLMTGSLLEEQTFQLLLVVLSGRRKVATRSVLGRKRIVHQADPHWGFPFPVVPGTIVVQRNGRGERLFLALVALCPVTCTPFMQDSART